MSAFAAWWISRSQAAQRQADEKFKLLRRFMTESSELIEQARQALAENRGADVAMLLHRLRGQAGNIGAMALMQQAGELEQSAAQGALQADALEDLAQALAALLQQVAASATLAESEPAAPAISSTAAAQPLDPELLAQFAAELARQSLAARRIYKTLQPGLHQALAPAAATALDDAMEALNFKAALAILESSNVIP